MPKFYKFKWDNITLDDYRKNSKVRADSLRNQATILHRQADQIELEADTICDQLVEVDYNPAAMENQ